MRILRQSVWSFRYLIHRYYYGIDIARTVRIGSSVIFDRTNPKGIHISDYTYITTGVTILSHDHVRSQWNLHTRIGAKCFIGNHTVILPGISIGNEVVIGAGSVVTKNIPSRCIAAGNPAKIIRTDISMNDDARLHDLL